MTLGIGDRVKFAYPEPDHNPDEFQGVITDVKYTVRWDDGSYEDHGPDELVPETD